MTVKDKNITNNYHINPKTAKPVRLKGKDFKPGEWKNKVFSASHMAGKGLRMDVADLSLFTLIYCK